MLKKKIPIMRKNIASLLFNDGSFSYTSSISLFCRLFSTSSKQEANFLVASPPPPSISILEDVLLHKFHCSPQSATHCAPILNRLKNLRNAELVLSLLKDYHFSNPQLEKLLKFKCSHKLFSTKPNTLKRKLKVLQDLGLPSSDITVLILINNSILRSNLNTRVIPSFSRLKGLLGTNEAAVKLCKKAPWLLNYDIDSRIVPNMEFLKTYGISYERIHKLLCLSPQSLLLKPESFKESVEKAEEMGAIRSSNLFIYAIKVISSTSEESWELKLQSFRNCGFSESDIANMFKKAPPMFAISTKKLQQVKDFILSNGKYGLSDIVNNPISLAYSIEDRYKARFKALEMLESRKLIAKWPSLSTVTRTTDGKFFEIYIDPYLDDVEKSTFQREMTSARKKSQLKSTSQWN